MLGSKQEVQGKRQQQEDGSLFSMSAQMRLSVEPHGPSMPNGLRGLLYTASRGGHVLRRPPHAVLKRLQQQRPLSGRLLSVR